MDTASNVDQGQEPKMGQGSKLIYQIIGVFLTLGSESNRDRETWSRGVARNQGG